MLKQLLLMLCLFVCMLMYAQTKLLPQQTPDGKTLAKQCSSCHNTTKTALADPLQGIRKIRTAKYIYSLIKNPMQFADENKTAKKVFAKRGLQMPPFPTLSNTDIKSILDYFDSLPKL